MSDVLLGLGRSREQRKLAAGPPGPWGVSSPSCRTEVLEVKAHVSFGRPIRGGLHRSSRLGHRQSRHRAVARAELRCPRRGRSVHTRRAGPPGPGSPWLLPKDFQLFCRGRRGPPCGGSVTGFLPPGGSMRVSQSPSLPSALLGVGTRLSPWSSCLSVSPHGHVLTSRAGRRSAPRLTPARPRTAPVLLGAAFPGLRHRHRPHVRASRFALAVFLIATEYRHVEAAAPQFGAFRQVSGHLCFLGDCTGAGGEGSGSRSLSLSH